MMCGAADVEELWPAFKEVARGVGAYPISYFNASTSFLNDPSSNWTEDSIESVAAAGLCVFVISEAYGQLTWESEMDAVVATGKPFLLLVRQRTVDRYRAISSEVHIDQLNNLPLRALYRAIRRTEDLNFTIVGYEPDAFGARLREALGQTLERGLISTVRLRTTTRNLNHLIAAPNAPLELADKRRIMSGTLPEQVNSLTQAFISSRVENLRLGEQWAVSRSRVDALQARLSHRKQIRLLLVGALLITGFILGALSNTLIHELRAESDAPNPTPTQVEPPTAPARAPTTTLSPSQRVRLTPSFENHGCDDGYVVQIASLGGQQKVPIEETAVAISDYVNRQLAASGSKMEVRASRGSDYCRTEQDEERKDNILLWIGPLSSFDEASTLRNQLKKDGVCSECLPSH